MCRSGQTSLPFQTRVLAQLASPLWWQQIQGQPLRPSLDTRHGAQGVGWTPPARKTASAGEGEKSDAWVPLVGIQNGAVTTEKVSHETKPNYRDATLPLLAAP